MTDRPADPFLLQIFHNLFASVAEEMGVALMRTASSPNIKERRDFSCALFDRRGRLVAQAAHIPVHLGAMPLAVEAVLNELGRDGWQPGDVAILNDPFLGGTHLPDVTMVSPVFLRSSPLDGQASGVRANARPSPTTEPLIGFVASRAHQADIGGMSPGSMPLSTELYQEGVIIPPIKWVEAGRINEAFLALLLRNVRTPEERRGDLEAQIAAHRVGERRLVNIVARYTLPEVERQIEALMSHGESLTRSALTALPAGSYSFTDFLDDDGLGAQDLPVVVTLHVESQGSVTVDFTGTAAEVLGPVNAVLAVTTSAVYYAVRCLSDEDLPTNQGCFVPVRVVAPSGTLANARPPRAVAGGNVETSQRITDAIFGALAQALPRRMPAAGQGTMNNVTIGGFDPERGREFAYYETLGGGMGGGPSGPGLSGIHVHMSNTLNTPVEALEFTYPFCVEEYSLRRGSGGAGRHRGGDGLRRVLRLDAPATVTVLSDRRRRCPYGLRGGEPGSPGRNFVRRQGAASEEEVPGKSTLRLNAGDVFGVETPGGGGWGTVERPGEVGAGH